MQDFKILIAGSRNFDTPKLRLQVRSFIDLFKDIHGAVSLVTGCAKSGGDLIAREIAEEMNVDVRVFVAEWDLLGKVAGFRRNEEMIDHIMKSFPMCCLIACYDGSSRGTMNTIQLAKRFKIPRYVLR